MKFYLKICLLQIKLTFIIAFLIDQIEFKNNKIDFYIFNWQILEIEQNDLPIFT